MINQQCSDVIRLWIFDSLKGIELDLLCAENISLLPHITHIYVDRGVNYLSLSETLLCLVWNHGEAGATFGAALFCTTAHHTTRSAHYWSPHC